MYFRSMKDIFKILIIELTIKKSTFNSVPPLKVNTNVPYI